MKYDIIIPVYNAPDYLKKCVESIRKHSKDYRIILVDNGSDNQTKELITGLKCLSDDMLVVTNNENLGFSKAVNAGLTNACAQYVCILNSDVEVCERWLDILESYFSRLGGFVGPCGRNVSSEGLNISAGKLVGDDIYEVDYLGMSCMFSSLDNFNFVGLLCEEYGLGYCEDTDYGMTIMEKGLKSHTIPLGIVHHAGKSAEMLDCNVLRNMQGKNTETFYRRWKDRLLLRESRIS